MILEPRLLSNEVQQKCRTYPTKEACRQPPSPAAVGNESNHPSPILMSELDTLFQLLIRGMLVFLGDVFICPQKLCLSWLFTGFLERSYTSYLMVRTADVSGSVKKTHISTALQQELSSYPEHLPVAPSLNKSQSHRCGPALFPHHLMAAGTVSPPRCVAA